ncbi:DUF4255 domain-containing protein [Microbacterium sp. BK668]|uniref:DUF4255 domain-containing protein n=1 Tax=Microbacterium sp. BK668 TaxID=2512118 RepID=UPI00105C1680|nr:DUF4255 domain-containing protein [Microbacterium sp. BK668]TDN90903.1 uncharacterized protein DUF4255 [Microbacterium sp. BK668]
MRDLSIVTDTLRDLLTTAVNTSPLFGGAPPPFSVTVSGQHPQTPGLSDSELNVYLFHVAPDKHLANSFWSQAAQHGTTPPVASEPLSLDLWYMVSAQSKTSYVHEQQILGIAMQAMHDNAILEINAPTPLPGAITPSQATVVLEAPSFDELSRLWQAFGLPLRTTAEYRVSVVFLTPDTIPADAPRPEIVNLVAAPGFSPAATPAKLFATRRTLAYTAPGPVDETVQLSPATTAPAPGPAAANQEVVLDGAGMLPGDHVVLVSYPGGVRTETDVTATWVAAGDPPFRLTPPAGAGAPAPGRHEVVLTRPTEPGWQSNAVPLNVAAWIDPAGGPLVTPNAQGRFSLTVGNVPPAGVLLRLGTTALTRIGAGTPQPGQWRLQGATLTFAAPAGTPAGTYLVGLRANDVEADPVKWAVVP